jgi:chromosome segregation ATPase
LALTQLDVEPDAIPNALGARRPRHRKRWIIGGLVFALLAGALGYVTGNERQANTEFDQTHSTLNMTTHRTDTALAELRTVRHELDVVNGQVSTDSTALSQDTAQLQGVQKALSGAEAAVVHQTSTIGDLQACLGGIEQALNALAVRDQTHAIAALDAVSTSCANAVASDG